MTSPAFPGGAPRGGNDDDEYDEDDLSSSSEYEGVSVEAGKAAKGPLGVWGGAAGVGGGGGGGGVGKNAKNATKRRRKKKKRQKPPPPPIADDSECAEILALLDDSCELIASPGDALDSAVAAIKSAKVLAVDCEGVLMSR